MKVSISPRAGTRVSKEGRVWQLWMYGRASNFSSAWREGNMWHHRVIFSMFPWIIWSRMKNVKKRYPQTEKKVGRKWLTLEQKRLKAHMQGMARRRSHPVGLPVIFLLKEGITCISTLIWAQRDFQVRKWFGNRGHQYGIWTILGEYWMGIFWKRHCETATLNIPEDRKFISQGNIYINPKQREISLDGFRAIRKYATAIRKCMSAFIMAGMWNENDFWRFIDDVPDGKARNGWHRMREKRKIRTIKSGSIDRIPPPQNMRKSRNSEEFRDLSVAGAEGFEPEDLTARSMSCMQGFWSGCGKSMGGHIAASFPHGWAVCASKRYASKDFDDLLMISDFLSLGSCFFRLAKQPKY